jgi:hypothetical protein
MGRATPIRDLAGRIVGMKPEIQEIDPVQVTLDASLQAVGVSDATAVSPPKPDIPKPLNASTFVLGTLLALSWVIILIMLTDRKAVPPQAPPLLQVTATATATVSPTPSPTAHPTATSVPTVIPTPVTFFSPPAVLSFCADRASMWGRTHQCGATQAKADALADAEIARINATAEAIRNKP